MNISDSFGRTIKGEWVTGKGTFRDIKDPNTVYLPSKEELGTTVILIYIGPNDSKAFVNVKIDDPVKYIDAGKDQTIPGLASTKPLGAVCLLQSGKKKGGIWKGGRGKFSNRTNPNTTYLPDNSEIGKTIRLTYFINNPGCSTLKSDYVAITFLPSEPEKKDRVVDQNKELEKVIPEKGMIFKMETLNFEPDSFNIVPSHHDELNEFVSVFKSTSTN